MISQPGSWMPLAPHGLFRKFPEVSKESLWLQCPFSRAPDSCTEQSPVSGAKGHPLRIWVWGIHAGEVASSDLVGVQDGQFRPWAMPCEVNIISGQLESGHFGPWSVCSTDQHQEKPLHFFLSQVVLPLHFTSYHLHLGSPISFWAPEYLECIFLRRPAKVSCWVSCSNPCA